MSPIRFPMRMTVAVIAVGLVAVALAAPEPSIVPESWELQFKRGEPGIISYKGPGDEKARLYGYLPYTVMNRTGEDRLFTPDLVVWTDAGDLMTGNRGVSPLVFNAIKEDLGNPLLESPNKVIGRLLQGEDNARESVIMWPIDPSRDVNVVRVFIGGLSGETQQVENPATGETVILKKTLVLEYHTPGDEASSGKKPFVFKEESWVMR